MATRAEPFQFLLAGLRDPDTLLPLNAGVVHFYVTGTTTPKNVWTEDAKTNAFTSYTLDSNGVAELFGDGNYKVVVKDSATETEYTFDPVKMGSAEHHNRTVTSDQASVSPEDDLIICDTSANAVTLNVDPVADFSRPVTVKATSTNYDVTWNPDGAETVDGAGTATLTGADDSSVFYPDQTGGEWKQANRFSGLTATITELNTAADGIADPPIAGDGTAGMVLRVAYLDIKNGTNASTLKMTLSSGWNGDAISEVDNISGGDVGDFNYGGSTLCKILAAGLTGNCEGVLAASITRNQCTKDLTVDAYYIAPGDIGIMLYDTATGAAVTTHSEVDNGDIRIAITYLTDA